MSVRRAVSRGFTLVEILVVIGIIGLLLALLLPAIQQSRESARRVQCKNQLRQIGLALLNHHDVHKSFPPGWTGTSETSRHDVIGPTGWGWASHILPFIEQNHVADRIALEWYMLHPANDVARSQSISLFLCPSDIPSNPIQLEHNGVSLFELPKSNYVANFGVGKPTECASLAFTGKQCDGGTYRGPFYHNSETRIAELSYGTSNTVVVGERGSVRDQQEAPATWTGVGPGLAKPFARFLGTTGERLNSVDDVDAFRSWHPGGVLFVYADGHVELLREEMDAVALAQASSIDIIGDSLLADAGTNGTDNDDGTDGSGTGTGTGTSTGSTDDTGTSGDLAADDGSGGLPWEIVPPTGHGEIGVCPDCHEETLLWWIHVPGLEDHE